MNKLSLCLQPSEDTTYTRAPARDTLHISYIDIIIAFNCRLVDNSVAMYLIVLLYTCIYSGIKKMSTVVKKECRQITRKCRYVDNR